jgi:hypothetical protein
MEVLVLFVSLVRTDVKSEARRHVGSEVRLDLDTGYLAAELPLLVGAWPSRVGYEALLFLGGWCAFRLCQYITNITTAFTHNHKKKKRAH